MPERDPPAPLSHPLTVRRSRWMIAASLSALFAACGVATPTPGDGVPGAKATASGAGTIAGTTGALAGSAGVASSATPPGELFDPPPMGPLPPPPPLPLRPPDKVPSAEEQARKIADCARFKSCNDCMDAHKCGYCPETGTCTPGDLFGPYPGTCSGAWQAMQCTLGPHEARRHDAETRAELAKKVAGLSPEGAAVDHAITATKVPVTFQVKRGKCYEVTLRLSGDIDERWDLKPTAIPHVQIYEGGDALPTGFDGYVLDKMCPQQDGTIDVYIVTYRAKKGAFRAQLWSAPIDEAELVKERDRHETAERRARVATWCKSCVEEWARCRVAAEPHCAASYYQCLAAAKLTPADCERGDTAPPGEERPSGPFNEARADKKNTL